jgi:hypothetical protein
MKVIFSTNLLLIIIFAATFSYGNNASYPGYVIKLNNDTLHGYIDYKNWEKNPKQIIFKRSELGASMLFTTKSIFEFSANNEIYRSAIVETDVSEFRTSDLTLSSDLNLIVDTVFLRALIIGTKSLYYLNDARGQECFYIEQNNKYELLVYKIYLKEERGKKYSVSNNKYIGQLILYLQNCKKINSVLSETSYNMRDLVKAFNYYYDCTQTKIAYRSTKKKLKLFFWLK